MIEVYGRTYRNCDVVLDGKGFRDCRFEHCALVWKSGGDFDCREEFGNDLVDCYFRFEGRYAYLIEDFLRLTWKRAGRMPRKEEDAEF